ncbi:hypothetical protein J4216_05350 [Candidatus Woesearchaeota archaeon]|nr:hypothetical protein [Candidatus Woesearchaeota archaeon]
MLAANKDLGKVYGLLQYRPEDKEIPHITGTNYRVDQIYCLPYQTWGLSPEDISKDKKLPLEAILQAIKWCENNSETLWDTIKKESEEAGLD